MPDIRKRILAARKISTGFAQSMKNAIIMPTMVIRTTTC
jgi:hypothetical protein